MRIQPWMTTVASLLMLAAVQTETAGQGPIPQGGQPGGAVAMPAHGGGGATVHLPPFATNHPQQVYPPGTPPGYQPWPQISPFQAPNIAQSQHVSRNGLWFRDNVYRGRKYYSSVELMSVQFRDAGQVLIGSPFARRADFDTRFPLGEPIDVADRDFPSSGNFTPAIPGFFPVDRRVLPIPLLASGANTIIDNFDGRFYPIHNTNVIDNPGAELGTQIRWGFENNDGTGLLLNGFWAFQDGGRFKSGDDDINGVPVNQAVTLALGGQNLFIHGVIPYFTGEPLIFFPEFGAGRTAKYDILFDVEQTTQAAGSNLSLYLQPIFKGKAVKVRPLYGARYMFIDEGFRFRGIDSGFSYDLDEDTISPAGALTLVHDQYEATLRSEVESHLAGPEIGLRYDLGDDRSNFKMWGETILGLVANHENIRINGDNIGDPLAEGRFENLNNPRMLDPTVQSEFSDRASSTHVSPIFQQSIFAQFSGFRSLPIIRNASWFHGASFRTGYTFLWVGELARPADAIKWQGFPLFPEVRSNRQSWWMHQMNFAIDWTY